MKKKEKQQFYTLDEILKKNARYNVIFGQRSNGKTFAVMQYIIEQYAKTGKQAALVRRWKDDFTGQRGAMMFEALVAVPGLIPRITGGKWSGVFYNSSRWYLSTTTEEGERIVDTVPFCFGFSLSGGEHDKSTSYPGITTILFDEFIARMAYLQDEFVLWMNTISTIVRQRDDVKIFMCGNTINPYCPHFQEMGLRHIKKMQPGDISLYKYGDGKLRIAVEFSDNPSKKGKPSDVYFAFDNPKLGMITGTGEVWELAMYPHCPRRFAKKDIVFTYFIEFNEDLMQCEIVSVDRTLFTFIHRKTTPLKNPDKDLIYTTEYDPRPNWRRRLFPAKTKLEKKLVSFFHMDKVFYQDNECGEVVRNYIAWSKTA